jgi:hypothetical protein
METSVILSRKMGEFEVTQRTKDGYFDGNALIRQWNSVEANTRRRLDDFLEYKSTQEFISEIKKEELRNLANGENQIVVKQKGRMTINGRVADKVWMHPYLFIDFAMWINPSFKVQVLKFVYDELIKHRNEAGDAYREMCEAIAVISSKGEVALNISKVAEAINHIAIGGHEKMIRNQANEDQMKELVRIEKEIAMLVKKRFVKTFDTLMEYLRNEWRTKNQPKLFAQ